MAVKRYNGTSWVTEAGAAAPLPSGMVVPFAGATAPTGWLLCDGGTFSATAYPELASVLGNTYGVASGDNYYKPDLRGRVVAGKDNMGGTAATRLTNTGTNNSGLNGATLGASGGDQRMLQHTHANTVSDTEHRHGGDQVNATTWRVYGATYGADGNHRHYPFEGRTAGYGANKFAAGTLSGWQNTGAGDNTSYVIEGGHQHSSYVDYQHSKANVTITNVNTGTGATENVQPTIILNYIIKT